MFYLFLTGYEKDGKCFNLKKKKRLISVFDTKILIKYYLTLRASIKDL